MKAVILGEGVKPEDAIKYWKAKIPLSDTEAKKLTDEARERAFYVSGLARLDQINAVHSALLDSLEKGETFRDFQSKIADIIKKKGWYDSRVENIFQTNMQTAYQAGRWASLMRSRKLRPYLQYSCILDKRTRPSHAVLHGLVYPIDHEFWDTHYPPNGFRCRCTVRSVSRAEVSRNKLTVQEKLPHNMVYTDKKTGAEIFVNQPMPDKGFFGNVGKRWLKSLEDPMFDKLEKTDTNIARAFVTNFVNRHFDTWEKNPETEIPIAVLSKEQAKLLASKSSVVRFSKDSMEKQKSHHPELTKADYAKAQEAVTRGSVYPQDENNLAFVLEEPSGVVCIVKATRLRDKLYLTSLRRLSRKDVKRKEIIAQTKKGKLE